MEIISIVENLFSKFLLKAISKIFCETQNMLMTIHHHRVDTEEELV